MHAKCFFRKEGGSKRHFKYVTTSIEEAACRINDRNGDETNPPTW
jgi:hypothetical protein